MNKEAATLAIIIEESDDDVFEIPELAMNRPIQGMEEDEEQSIIVEDDGSDIIVTHERTLKRPRKKLRRIKIKSNISTWAGLKTDYQIMRMKVSIHNIAQLYMSLINNSI